MKTDQPKDYLIHLFKDEYLLFKPYLDQWECSSCHFKENPATLSPTNLWQRPALRWYIEMILTYDPIFYLVDNKPMTARKRLLCHCPQCHHIFIEGETKYC